MLVPFDVNKHTAQDVGFGDPSTEVTITVDMPDNTVGIIPSVWWDTKGNPTLVDEATAIQLADHYEKQTSNKFPRFGKVGNKTNYTKADAWAQKRSAKGGATQSPLAKEGTDLYFDVPEQLIKGLYAEYIGDASEQTNEDFSPEVVDVLREGVKDALYRGEMSVGADNYDSPNADMTGSSEARGGFLNFVDHLFNDPKGAAAFSVGKGDIQIEDGNVYLVDKYDFEDSELGDDAYSYIRKGLHYLIPDDNDVEKNTVKLYMGTVDELMPEDLNADPFPSSI